MELCTSSLWNTVNGYFEPGKTHSDTVSTHCTSLTNTTTCFGCGKGKKLVKTRQVQETTRSRFKNTHDVRNSLALLVVLHQAVHPRPELPDYCISSSLIYNLDTTSIQFDQWNKSKTLYIDAEYEKEIRQNKINPKFLRDLDKEPTRGPFQFKLMTAIRASGSTGPIVGIMKVKDLPPGELLIHEIADFGTNQDQVGWVFGVASFEAVELKKVYAYYFKHIFIPHVKEAIENEKKEPRYDLDHEYHELEEHILLTLDGDQVQLESVQQADILQELIDLKVRVIKLPAATSERNQANDVALCYLLLKAALGKFMKSAYVSEKTLRSLDRIVKEMMNDPETAPYRSLHLHHLRRAVIAIQPLLQMCFTTAHIRRAFDTTGQWPLQVKPQEQRTFVKR